MCEIVSGRPQKVAEHRLAQASSLAVLAVNDFRDERGFDAFSELDGVAHRNATSIRQVLPQVNR
jgi:hypothetical protein